MTLIIILPQHFDLARGMAEVLAGLEDFTPVRLAFDAGWVRETSQFTAADWYYFDFAFRIV